jgi:hypothetical protein
MSSHYKSTQMIQIQTRGRVLLTCLKLGNGFLVYQAGITCSAHTFLGSLDSWAWSTSCLWQCICLFRSPIQSRSIVRIFFAKRYLECYRTLVHYHLVRRFVRLLIPSPHSCGKSSSSGLIILEKLAVLISCSYLQEIGGNKGIKFLLDWNIWTSSWLQAFIQSFVLG